MQDEPIIEALVQQALGGQLKSVVPMQQDASSRSYLRLEVEHNETYKNYVLMKSSAIDDQQMFDNFIQVAQLLTKHQLLAPEIFAYDQDNGLLLLEDFGTITVKEHLMSLNEADSFKLYQQMVHLIFQLQNIEAVDLPIYYDEQMLSELEVFTDYYFPYAATREIKMSEFEEFIDIWQRILTGINYNVPQLMLRDYHVENLMWLGNDVPTASFGILDFQDAARGPLLYDLVSLLQDARIVVQQEMALNLLAEFSKNYNLQYEQALEDFHILGAQRNMRILGVFMRKNHQGANQYMQYVPTVLHYLKHNLSHPKLRSLKIWLEKYINL